MTGYNFGTDSNQQLDDPQDNESGYKLRIFQSSSYLLVHVLIGFVVGGALMFAFREGVPIGATPLHITLCVIGYQLLMAQAILSMSPHNSWSSQLRIVDKRRVHWILQITGSGLAISGTFIKIIDTTDHFNTNHGRFGLVALAFTSVALVNGLASLWSYELRNKIRIPPKLSKVTHICFGIVAFGASSITLCYGIDKELFRNQFGQGVANTLIAFIACYTTIIIINPLMSFVLKFKGS